MALTGLRAFQVCSGVKLHFSQEKYDVTKFGFNTKRFNAKVYESRRDKYFYQKLANDLQLEDRLVRFLAANFIYDPDIWIGDMVENDSCRSNYLRMRKVREGITHHIIQDTKNMMEDKTFKELFECDMDLPYYIKAVLTKEINPETAVIYNRLFNSFELVDKSLGEDHLIWKGIRNRLLKFSTFVTLPDKETMLNIRDEIREVIMLKS